MKLRKLAGILGLSAALLAAAACTGTAGENTAQENEVTEEAESAEDSSEATAEDTAEDISTEENGAAGGAVSEAPARIYGTITEAGEDTIIVENQSDVSASGEIILTIDPENTVLVDGQTGLPVSLSDISSGSFTAYLGPAMTMSLPPQSTPYVVIVNVPEDSAAPRYAVLAEDLSAGEDGYTLTATDGQSYQIPEDVEITPFRTRNIAALPDLTAGRACLIWLDENETAEKIVLLEGEAQESEAAVEAE